MSGRAIPEAIGRSLSRLGKRESAAVIAWMADELVAAEARGMSQALDTIRLAPGVIEAALARGAQMGAAIRDEAFEELLTKYEQHGELTVERDATGRIVKGHPRKWWVLRSSRP